MKEREVSEWRSRDVKVEVEDELDIWFAAAGGGVSLHVPMKPE